jgi:hypothetical protein
MLNYSVRRVALAGVSVVVAGGLAFVTSACGARPTVGVAEPVIIAQTQPSTSTTPSATVPPVATPSADSPSDAPGAAGATAQGGALLDPAPLVQAAAGVEPNTTLGAVVFDRVTGQPLLSVNADRQFRSASLVKLMIAIDALSRGANATDRQQIARMLSMSDDQIASALWVKGGRGVIKHVAAMVGLQDTEAPEEAGKWGEVKLTANDMVRLYQYIMDRLPPEDHTLIVDALAQAPEYAADGSDQYFGIPDGLNIQWAIKQGWGNNTQTMVLHSTGLVGADFRYVVILLTEHPLGSGWSTCKKSVTAAAEALAGQLPGA